MEYHRAEETDASLLPVTRTLDNGLTVIAQPMPWLRTAALTVCVPGGTAAEDDHQSGLASLTCEMVQRGAGKYSSREIVATQDLLGMDRSGGVSVGIASLGSTMPAESLAKAMELYGMMIKDPTLPVDQVDDAQMMAIQELHAMEDEPTQRVVRRLRELQFGPRLGRSVFGDIDAIKSLRHPDVVDFWKANYHAGGGILAVAGRIDVEEVFRLAQAEFGDLQPGDPAPLHPPKGNPTYEHLEADSSQTHIAFSFDSIPYGHKDYFSMRAGIGILSDGMSSRLFDRVREQRGLCYTVSANCSSFRNAACVIGYAGTTPERAQETLDVTIGEVKNIARDLTQDELDRWKVRIQSSLIMEQESSASRASSLASDMYQVGRVVLTEELESVIESITIDRIRDYWTGHPPANFRLVTLGTDPLDVSAI